VKYHKMFQYLLTQLRLIGKVPKEKTFSTAVKSSWYEICVMCNNITVKSIFSFLVSFYCTVKNIVGLT